MPRLGTAGFVGVLAGAWFLSGCAGEAKRDGFEDVRRIVDERSGLRVVWNRGSPEDLSVDVAVRGMLGREISADEAVQVALLNNRELQATYEELGIAQADLVQAGLLRNPFLSMEMRFPKKPAFPFEIDFTQDFLDLFLIPLRTRVAGAAYERAKLRVAHAVLEMAARARAAAFEYQAAEQMLELWGLYAAATEASEYAAERLHDAGNMTDFDFANQKAAHEGAMLEKTEAEGRVVDARATLSALMGVWGADGQWHMEKRLADLPAETISADELERAAVARRLDLAAARREVRVMVASLGMTRARAALPGLDLTAHAEGEPEGIATVGPSIGVVLPLWDQGQGAIGADEARLRQAWHRYAALMVEVRAEVQRACNRVKVARKRVERYRGVLMPLRQQITEDAQLRYNAMQIGMFDLLRIRQQQIDTGRAYVEALRDYWVARSELQRAVGARIAANEAATSQPVPAVPPVVATQPAEAAPMDHSMEMHHHAGGSR